jgi:hypothetical protein
MPGIIGVVQACNSGRGGTGEFGKRPLAQSGLGSKVTNLLCDLSVKGFFFVASDEFGVIANITVVRNCTVPDGKVRFFESLPILAIVLT